MNRAILITGFNNWGKSTQIETLFGRQRFYRQGQYSITGVNALFTVESQSNDDVGEIGFLGKVAYKLDYPNCTPPVDLLCAFCPTKELWNDSRRILSEPLFASYSEIHLFLLKYKWDMHAELRIGDISSYLSTIANVRITIIGSTPPSQNSEIISNLQRLYP